MKKDYIILLGIVVLFVFLTVFSSLNIGGNIGGLAVEDPSATIIVSHESIISTLTNVECEEPGCGGVVYLASIAKAVSSKVAEAKSEEEYLTILNQAGFFSAYNDLEDTLAYLNSEGLFSDDDYASYLQYASGLYRVRTISDVTGIVDLLLNIETRPAEPELIEEPIPAEVPAQEVPKKPVVKEPIAEEPPVVIPEPVVPLPVVLPVENISNTTPIINETPFVNTTNQTLPVLDVLPPQSHIMQDIYSMISFPSAEMQALSSIEKWKYNSAVLEEKVQPIILQNPAEHVKEVIIDNKGAHILFEEFSETANVLDTVVNFISGIFKVDQGAAQATGSAVRQNSEESLFVKVKYFFLERPQITGSVVKAPNNQYLIERSRGDDSSNYHEINPEIDCTDGECVILDDKLQVGMTNYRITLLDEFGDPTNTQTTFSIIIPEGSGFMQLDSTILDYREYVYAGSRLMAMVK